MVRVRPFQFSRLPRYSADQVALQESISRFFSRNPFHRSFSSSMVRVLETLFKTKAHLAPAPMRPLARAEVAAMLPDRGVFAILGTGASERKIVVEIESGLVASAIERLLGGTGESARARLPLTDIEEGILSLAVLKVLGHFHDGWPTLDTFGLTLDRFANRIEDVDDWLDAESLFYAFGVNVGLGRVAGYVRIMLPASLIQTAFSSPLDQGPVEGPELKYCRRTLAALGSVSVVARVEAAEIALSVDEIASLEPGDIVVLDHHSLTKTPESFTGEVLVKLGHGENGAVRGCVSADGAGMRLTLSAIVVQESPQETDMADSDNNDEAGQGPEVTEAGDNLEQTQSLLRDVPAPVVVELGRLRLSTAQVMRLRAGQVLRLPRGPRDPVDLVVGDKVFARGELVEVEGELGVRILKVTGAE